MPALLPSSWRPAADRALRSHDRSDAGSCPKSPPAADRRRRAPRRPNERGVTIVEFSLVLPLLVILIFTIVDFGIYFFAQHTIQFATREGARLALVGRTVSDGNGQPLSREASVVKKIQDCAAIVIPADRLQISVYPINADLTDPRDWQNTRDAGSPGAYMRVRTRYEYKFITPFLGALVRDGKLAVTAQATYRNEFFN